MTSDYDSISEAVDHQIIAEKLIEEFASQLYSDPAHFILELLQNAEDALSNRPPGWREKGRRKVCLFLQPDRLIVSHFGKPFNTADVKAICTVFKTTKTEGQIGKFGIGFKSVYVLTSEPEIYSGDEAFKIVRYFHPKAAKRPNGLAKDETRFVLPFRNDKDGGIEAIHKQIGLGLEQLEQDTLLFLKQIESIEWVSSNGNRGNLIRNARIRKKAFVRDVTLSGSAEPSMWRVFQRRIPIGDKGKGFIEIAFSLENTKEKEQVINLGSSKLTAFFPTNYDTGLGFVVQGPYSTTPARDNITKDEWNSYLAQETSELVVEALIWMRDKKILNTDVLLCMPLNTKYIDRIYSRICYQVKVALREERLIPNNWRGTSKYNAASELKIARSSDLRNLFNSKQVLEEFFGEGVIAWVDGEITEYGKTSELHDFLRDILKIDVVRPEYLFADTPESFFKSQKDKWIKRLYAFLNKQSTVDYLESVPIVRLRTGKHVPPDSERVFLSDPSSIGVPTVKKSLLDKQSRELFGRLDIREPDLIDEVSKHILKFRYNDNEGSEIVQVNSRQYADDIGKILTAYKSKSGRMGNVLKDFAFVKSVDWRGNNPKFVKPEQVYWPTSNLKKLFKGIPEVRFVDVKTKRFKTKIAKKMLLDVGVAECIRPVKVTNTMTKKGKMKLRDEFGDPSYISDISFTDWKIDGLENLISKLPKLNQQQQKVRSLQLWKCLVECVKHYRNRFEGSYEWLSTTEKKKKFPPHFIRLLTSKRWVVNKRGDRLKPAQIEFETLKNLGWEANPILAGYVLFMPSGATRTGKKLGLYAKTTAKMTDAMKIHGSDVVNKSMDEMLDVLLGNRDSTSLEDESGGSNNEGAESRSRRATRTRAASFPVRVQSGRSDPEGHEKRQAVEKRAIKAILEEEAHLKVAPEKNPGFDMYKVDADKKRVRWIEVKSMRSSWHGRYVSMTRRQVEEALRRKDSFWLYVVENVYKPTRRIYRIQNPLMYVSQFQFFKDWKEFDQPKPD